MLRILILAIAIASIGCDRGLPVSGHPRSDTPAAKSVESKPVEVVALQPAHKPAEAQSGPEAKPKSKPSKQEPEQEPESKATAEKQATVWIDASKDEVVIGDLRIGAAAAIGPVLLRDFRNRQSRSEGEYLQVLLSISNHSKTKIVQFIGWQSDFSIGDAPRAEDSYANFLRGVSFEATLRPEAQARVEDIDPGKRAEDLLVFRKPVEGFKYVRVTLPASNFGGKGKIHLQFPAKSIQINRKPD